MRLSIIVPCYNEADNIKPFYDETVKALPSLIDETEILFINDGSQDATYERASEVIEDSPYDVHMLSFSRNFGKEAALLAGLEHASGEYVAIIDADLQQDPLYLAQMYQFLQSHPDYDEVAMVQDTRKESKILVFFKNCFYKLINKMTDVEIVKSASDFRMLRRNVVEAILSLPEKNRFSKGIFAWVGFNVKFMPYEGKERRAGESKWSFWKLFAYAIDGIIGYSTTPLVVSSTLGFILCLISIILIIILFIKTLCFNDHLPGYPTMVTLLLFGMGVQLLAIGVVGEYLAKTYIEAKDRPMYIIKKHMTKQGEIKDVEVSASNHKTR